MTELMVFVILISMRLCMHEIFHYNNKKKVSVVDHSPEFTVMMKTHRVRRRKNLRGIKEPPAASLPFQIRLLSPGCTLKASEDL